MTAAITEIESPLHNEVSKTGTYDEFIFEGPPASIQLRDVNIGQLLDEKHDKYSERVAAVSLAQGRRLKYQEFHRGCRDIAQSLLIHGVRPKDHVVVLAGNTIEYAQLFFAVGGIGAIFAIINPTFTAEDVLTTIDFLDPKAIFVADRIGYRNNKSLLADIQKKREDTSLIVQLVTVAKVAENVPTWHEFLQKHPSDAQPGLFSQYWAKADSNDTLCIQFTSGTTGPRKAAMLSHWNLLNNALLVGHQLEYTPNDAVCCCTPLFHCFALVCGVIATITYGGTVVLPSDVFIAGTSLQALSEEGCTVIHSVSTMFQAMMDHPDAKKHSPKLRLRTGIVAGSSLPSTLMPRLSAEFKLKDLAYAYGMTELSCIAFMTRPSEVSLLDDWVSVGTAMAYSSAKVVDSDLNTLPPGSSGELLVSGYLVFQGYYKNPAKTEEALVSDSQGRKWLRTGDLATITSAGRCTIIGRVKDMIKRGGENIFPRDIEKVLELHPDIATAAVIGIPNSYWGEIVGVFLQRTKDSKSETEIGKKELKMWLRNRIAPHKVPEHYFWIGEGNGIPNEFPINHSGKLVKAELQTVASALVQANGTS